jgi:hypothetical protein
LRRDNSIGSDNGRRRRVKNLMGCENSENGLPGLAEHHCTNKNAGILGCVRNYRIKIRMEDDKNRINRIEIEFKIVFIKLRPAVIKRKVKIFFNDNDFIVIKIRFGSFYIIILRFRIYNIVYHKFYCEI